MASTRRPIPHPVQNASLDTGLYLLGIPIGIGQSPNRMLEQSNPLCLAVGMNMAVQIPIDESIAKVVDLDLRRCNQTSPVNNARSTKAVISNGKTIGANIALHQSNQGK